MGKRCDIKFMFFLTLIWYLFDEITNATQTTDCYEGTYSYYSGDDRFCMTCPQGTFMHGKEHNKTSCFDCTEIEDSTVEIIIQPCDKLYDTDIQCVDGYYRRLDRIPSGKALCQNCSTSCPEHYFQVYPCGNFTDIGCCPGETFDKTRFRKCRDSLKTCSKGQYLDTLVNDCKPCPEQTFMPENYHSHTKCRDCWYISHTDLPLHVIMTEPCTSTRPPEYGCQNGFYMKKGSSLRGDDITCSPCQTCDEGKYVGQQCNMYHDTVCCDKPNTAVAYIPHGGQCIEVIGEPFLHPYVGILGVKQGGCQSVMCYVALKREKKKPDLTWVGENVGKHQQFQFEEQNNQTGMTVYHNTLTVCNFSAADEGEYRCRDSIWTLRMETHLSIVLACKDGSYNPPDCDKTCSQHCRPSERSDVSPCDHNNGTCLLGCLDGYTGVMCEKRWDKKDRNDGSVGYISAIVFLVALVLALLALGITCVVYTKRCMGSGPLWWQRLVRYIFTEPKKAAAEDIEQQKPLMEDEQRLEEIHNDLHSQKNTNDIGTQLRKRRVKPDETNTADTRIWTREIEQLMHQLKDANERDTERQKIENERQRNIAESKKVEREAGLKQMEELKKVQKEKKDKLEPLEERERTLQKEKKQLKQTLATLEADKADTKIPEARKEEEMELQNKIRQIEEQLKFIKTEKKQINDEYGPRIDELEKESKEFVEKEDVQKLLKEPQVNPNISSTIHDEEILSKIRTLFVTYIMPLHVLDLFHHYNRNVLTQQDIEFIRVRTSQNGRYDGAGELLSCLISYKDWFSCLIQILRHPQLKQGHVADAMWDALGMGETRDKNLPIEEVKQKLKTAVTTLQMMKQYHSEDGIKCLTFIYQTFFDYDSDSDTRRDLGDCLTDFGCVETCMKFLQDHLNSVAVENDQIWPVIDKTLDVCWDYCSMSVKFAKKLADLDGINFFTEILRDRCYLDHLDRQRESRVVEASTVVLVNIAVQAGVIYQFKDCRTVEALMSLTKCNSDILKVKAMIALAELVKKEGEEERKVKLTDPSDVISTLIQWIPKALENKKERRTSRLGSLDTDINFNQNGCVG